MDPMTNQDWLSAAAILAGFVSLALTLHVNGRASRRTQNADTYFKLETEASRLFEIARQSPELIAYLEGAEVDAAEAKKYDRELVHYLPQVLNLFEISILFRDEGIFERDTFSTWLAWYLEIAMAKRFPGQWEEMRLHYRPELREIMQAGIECANAPGKDLETITEDFFKEVSVILADPKLYRHYKTCVEDSNIRYGMKRMRPGMRVPPPATPEEARNLPPPFRRKRSRYWL